MNIDKLIDDYNENILPLKTEICLKDKEIERLNNELELQNIEMGREIERLKSIIKEVREYIQESDIYKEDILQILNKVEESK